MLTDLYTVLNEMGTIDGLTFLCIATCHAHHAFHFLRADPVRRAGHLRGPAEMSLTPEFKKELEAYNLRFTEADHVADVIDQADVIYMEPVVQPDYTKARQEASADKGLTPANYQVTSKLLAEKAKSDAIFCTLCPLMDELRRMWTARATPVIGRGFQRRGDAHGAAGAGFGRDGV